MPLILLALYIIVMSKWCERKELLVNFLSHGRYGHADLKEMIGCIAHPVLLRIGLESQQSLRDVLKLVTGEFHASLARDASHLDAISDEITEVYFNWLPAGWGISGTYELTASGSVEDGDGRMRITTFPVETPMFVKFAPAISDTPSGIVATLWYDKSLFLRSTVERFTHQLRQCVDILAANPNARLGSLDLRI
jgi:non-ribosomal peptide synthetase component F